MDTMLLRARSAQTDRGTDFDQGDVSMKINMKLLFTNGLLQKNFVKMERKPAEATWCKVWLIHECIYW